LVFGKPKNEPDLVVEQATKHSRVDLKSRSAKWARERASRDRLAFRRALAQDLRQKQSRVHARETERYSIGEWALIPRINRQKTQTRWQGPYEIVQVREGGTYRLKNVSNFRDRVIRHHRYLRPYRRRDPTNPNPPKRETINQTKTRSRKTKNAHLKGEGMSLNNHAPEPETDKQTNGDSSEQCLDATKDVERVASNDDPPIDRRASESTPSTDQMDVTEQVDDEDQRKPETDDPEKTERSRIRKEASRSRRPADSDEQAPDVLCRSKRSNKGIPPRKYFIDAIQSFICRISRISRRLSNWQRSHNPVKQQAIALLEQHGILPSAGGRV
jgi:hypothetical protein